MMCLPLSSSTKSTSKGQAFPTSGDSVPEFSACILQKQVRELASGFTHCGLASRRGDGISCGGFWGARDHTQQCSGLFTSDCSGITPGRDHMGSWGWNLGQLLAWKCYPCCPVSWASGQKDLKCDGQLPWSSDPPVGLTGLVWATFLQFLLKRPPSARSSLQSHLCRTDSPTLTVLRKVKMTVVNMDRFHSP